MELDLFIELDLLMELDLLGQLLKHSSSRSSYSLRTLLRCPLVCTPPSRALKKNIFLQGFSIII